MLQAIVPKLPAKDIEATKAFYLEKLEFKLIGQYVDYILLTKDQIEIHFYLDQNVVPHLSDRMVYIRVSEHIEKWYEELLQKKVELASLGKLEPKPWGQLEFSILDINGTLLTFGQPVLF
ncbi:MAG TPA: VOC family protein [Saprospiraceae bacterium]|nr:VOC family protein [Saprospiraceae bacterium]HMQ84811.1 VOC family protein [Saprospiraceae bacterium]